MHGVEVDVDTMSYDYRLPCCRGCMLCRDASMRSAVCGCSVWLMYVCCDVGTYLYIVRSLACDAAVLCCSVRLLNPIVRSCSYSV